MMYRLGVAALATIMLTAAVAVTIWAVAGSSPSALTVSYRDGCVLGTTKPIMWLCPAPTETP